MTESFEQRLQRVLRDPVRVVPCDAAWPGMFRREAAHLRACLPAELVGRIEHVGSTAVPGLAAKPVVDMLIEVVSVDEAHRLIAPVLESQGYDYFWRPGLTENERHYPWFIGRGADGRRTHHLHMVEADFEHWDQLVFRDYLIAHPEVAAEYARLKYRLAAEHAHDRIAYTQGKTEFIVEVTARAKRAGRGG